MKHPGTLRLCLLLTVGTLAVSCASILIRLASAPALAIAAYRLIWATLILAPFAPSRLRDVTAISLSGRLQLLLSGIALALHFGLWISSLSYTSVASSVLLVDTTPFFIGLASHWFLRRTPQRTFWIGLLIAFLGCIAVFHGDWVQSQNTVVSQNTVKGNALALGGAIAMAIYLLVGAKARQKLSLLAYIWPVYLVAAGTLVTVCLVSHIPLRGFSNLTLWYLFLLGLVPQCIGHTTYNWALRWLSPALVALITLAEPVGATVLAYIILHESLSLAKALGGATILLGIYIAARFSNH